MDVAIEVDAGSYGGAVDLRVTSRDDATSGRPLNLTLSGLAETEERSPRCYTSTPPDTPTSPPASAFKKTMLKRYSTYTSFFLIFCRTQAKPAAVSEWVDVWRGALQFLVSFPVVCIICFIPKIFALKVAVKSGSRRKTLRIGRFG